MFCTLPLLSSLHFSGSVQYLRHEGGVCTLGFARFCYANKTLSEAFNIVSIQRKACNGRTNELKTIGGKIISLMSEIRSVVDEYSNGFGSEFGMTEVAPPTRLEEILPIPSFAGEARLSDILTIIERKVLYDTSMVLDKLRSPLRILQDGFLHLDLDEYLQPVEHEEFLEDQIQMDEDDRAYVNACKDVCKRIRGQMAQVHIQRKLFIKELEEATSSYRQERKRMHEEKEEALLHLHIPPGKTEVSCLREVKGAGTP